MADMLFEPVGFDTNHYSSVSSDVRRHDPDISNEVALSEKILPNCREMLWKITLGYSLKRSSSVAFQTISEPSDSGKAQRTS